MLQFHSLRISIYLVYKKKGIIIYLVLAQTKSCESKKKSLANHTPVHHTYLLLSSVKWNLKRLAILQKFIIIPYPECLSEFIKDIRHD